MTVAGQSAISYGYDADRLTSITQGTSTVSFGYDDANRRTSLIGIVDRSGNRLRIERSGAQISRLVSPRGRTLDFTLDASNRVTSVTDHIGRQITYTDNGSAVSGKLPTPAYDSNRRGMRRRSRI
jgi:YD repeat-containing protein